MGCRRSATDPGAMQPADASKVVSPIAWTLQQVCVKIA